MHDFFQKTCTSNNNGDGFNFPFLSSLYSTLVFSGLKKVNVVREKWAKMQESSATFFLTVWSQYFFLKVSHIFFNLKLHNTQNVTFYSKKNPTFFPFFAPTDHPTLSWRRCVRKHVKQCCRFLVVVSAALDKMMLFAEDKVRKKERKCFNHEANHCKNLRCYCCCSEFLERSFTHAAAALYSSSVGFSFPRPSAFPDWHSYCVAPP